MVGNLFSKDWEIIEIKKSYFEESLLSIPRNPGLYRITSNIPKSELKTLTNRKGKNHVDFVRRLSTTEKLLSGLEIEHQENESRVIYTGHHKFLRDRCRNHFRGYDGTGCLNLFELENFSNYKWTFEYFNLRRMEGYEDSIITRTALEQHYRAKIGWPILCDK